jgi:hypothetical protein
VRQFAVKEKKRRKRKCGIKVKRLKEKGIERTARQAKDLQQIALLLGLSGLVDHQSCAGSMLKNFANTVAVFC